MKSLIRTALLVVSTFVIMGSAQAQIGTGSGIFGQPNDMHLNTSNTGNTYVYSPNFLPPNAPVLIVVGIKGVPSGYPLGTMTGYVKGFRYSFFIHPTNQTLYVFNIVEIAKKKFPPGARITFQAFAPNILGSNGTPLYSNAGWVKLPIK